LNYSEFLESKQIKSVDAGFDVSLDRLHPAMRADQKAVVQWAIKKGRAALFLDTGLGKTFDQLEWARIIHEETGLNVLILAPLAVSSQTIREGERWGVTVRYAHDQTEVVPGITITNYERIERFDPDYFGAICLDESSILKAFGGDTRKRINEFSANLPYRLACTATPAPNDLVELTNHAEFLGVMSGKEIIALFFTQDGNTTQKWRLKGHAKKDFWKWMATWCVAMRKPSDLGFSDEGFDLPPLNLHSVVVEAPVPEGQLFAAEGVTLAERRAARKRSLDARVAEAASHVNASEDPYLVWCDFNPESEALKRAIPGAVEVKGSDSPEHKVRAALDFAEGRVRVLISKPSIFGWGMNWQHCANIAFVGVSDSFEQQYQAIRRCYRFGQTRPVNVTFFTSEAEGNVVRNVQRKAKQAMDMMDSLIEAMGILNLDGHTGRDEMDYEEDVAQGGDWTLYLGDSVKQIDKLEDDSVGLSLFSPPFPCMYAYTNSVHDLGNTNSIETFMDHFRFLVGPEKLLRVTKPGRKCCIHLMQLTSMLSREGVIGLKDYRGSVIKMMQDSGWIYSGEATIDKNPQVQATRNKERGLLFKSLATDSAMMRMALADYLIYFTKPGENAEPIRAGISKKYNPTGGSITEEEWIEWASPVWKRLTPDNPGGIHEGDVLNVKQARTTDDERHLCPLQLGVINRAVKLWSNPGDLVLDPFNGIGSTGVKALELGRRYVGIELKRSYYESAKINLFEAEAKAKSPTLYSYLESLEAVPT